MMKLGNRILILTLLSLFITCLLNAQGIWSSLSGPEGYNSPQAMAVSPITGSVFISSNINGAAAGGVWKSDNNGILWTEVSSGLGRPYARDLVFFQNDLYAASDSVIYRFNGTTWQVIDSLLPNNSLPQLLVVHRDTLLSAISYANGDIELYRLNPVDDTWQATGTVFNFLLQLNKLYSDQNTLWAATGNGVQKSTGGINNFIFANTNIPFNASIISIVAKGDTAYCGTTNGSYYTTNGGSLWQPVSSPPLITPLTAYSLLISNNQVIAGFLNNGIYSSPLGENNWTPFGNGYPSQVIAWNLGKSQSHTFANSSEGFFAISGSAWQLRNDGITSARTSIVFTDSNEIIASPGALSLLQRSTNAGQTWADYSNGLPVNVVDIYRKAIKVAGVMIMPSLFGMYRSINNGLNWQSVSGSVIPNREAAVFGTSIIAPAGPNVAFSTDLGLTWNPYSSGIGSPRTVYSIAVRGASAYAGTNNGVFEMATAGAAWVNYSTGLPNNSFIQKMVVFRDNLIVTTNNGIYYRRPGDIQWQQGAQGFFFNDMIVFESMILAAGSNGVYFSNNEGKSFHLFNSDYTGDMESIESLWADRNLIYAGTTQSSLWKCGWYDAVFTQPFIGPFGSFCTNSQETFEVLSPNHTAGNTYRLELSDSAGRFLNPVVLGTLTNYQPGFSNTISVVIPDSLPAGNRYRYRFVSTNPVLPAVDNGFDLILRKSASINLQPANQNVCVGENTAFLVVASGTGLNYQWQVDILGNGNFINVVNNASFQDADKPLLRILNAQAGLNGSRYRCIINNSCSNVTSSIATLTINGSSAFIINQPAAFSICEGESDTLIINAVGPSVSYQWQQQNAGGFFTDISNGPLFTGVNTDTLILSNVPAAFNGSLIRCKVNGCTISDTLLITVNGQAVSATLPGPAPFCTGGNVSFNVNTSGGGLTYQWEEDNGSGYTTLSNSGIYSGVNSSTLLLENIPGSYDGYLYRCIIQGLCSIDSSSAGTGVLELNPTPIINQQPTDTGICEGLSSGFSVSASGAFLNYLWEINSGNGWQPIAPFPPFNGTSSASLIIDSTISILNGSFFRCRIGSCVTSDSARLEVKTVPMVTAPHILVCELQLPFPLSSASPAGGIYIGYGIYNGVFDPSIISAGLYPYTYSYTAPNGCESTKSGNIDFRVCTGLEDNQTEESFSMTLFPNPSNGLFWLRLNQPLKEPSLLEVYSIQGRLMHSQRLIPDPAEYMLNLDSFSDGLYIIRVTGSSVTASGRLILSRQ